MTTPNSIVEGSAGLKQLALEMVSPIKKVVVLCWKTPATSDRNAYKIAAFLGAEPTFVSLAAEALGDAALIRKLIPQCACLIAEAETLAKAVDAMPNGLRGINDLTDLAAQVFIYGFQPTHRHDAVLRALSGGGLVGVRPLASGDAKFHVTESHRDFCGQFSGLSFGIPDPSLERSFIEGPGERQQDVIIRAGDEPCFVRGEHGASKILCSSCSELADLDENVGREAHVVSWFTRLVPLMMFLRGALGNQLWHDDSPRACFIIDDPLLRRRYGFLRYKGLLDSMRREKFSTCIAFIPWNYRRSSNEVAELFLSNGYAPHLCVHGCDHSRAEFASTDVGLLRRKAALALERMREHQRRFGIPFDEVMVFPQGLFSAEAMTALKASGYMAAVNSEVFPSTMPASFALRDLLDVAVTQFADFPLFGRRYPSDLVGLAFDLFLGKPALAVEHHGYFKNGFEPMEAFVRELNGQDERLEWTNLGTVCSRASLRRIDEDGDIHVRFYTRRFLLTNTDAEAHRYVLFPPRTANGRLPSVTINGRKWECEREDGQVRIGLSLGARQSAEIEVLPEEFDFKDAPLKVTAIHNAKAGIRRILCEVRDNYVETNRFLKLVVSASRKVLGAAKRQAAPLPEYKARQESPASVSASKRQSAQQIEPHASQEVASARLPRYVLVTPARNEATYIRLTLDSIVAQTVPPLKWVIVSDGSTDGTDEIVSSYAAKHDWIELVRLPERSERNFAGKVAAFNAGQAKVAGLKYDVIGNLDADVSFDEEYFCFLLHKLADDPELGLVGTPYRDPLNQPYDYRFVSSEHVTGPCQLFRRECFQAIGGYIPVKGGAIDRIADISARMKGWKTRTFTEKVYLHHRATGTSQEALLIAKFRDGAKDYSVGNSPIWELFRTTYQMTKRPFILGGLMTGAGYAWSQIRRAERPVSREMVEFCRREQMQRLKAFVLGRAPAGRQKRAPRNLGMGHHEKENNH
jgi:hypothetical protein